MIEAPPPKRPRDIDSVMLGGCSAFVVSSFITYAFGVLPFFISGDLGTWQTLGTATAAGVTATMLFTAISARASGHAGWFGCIGGALAVGVFLYLTLERVTPLTRGPNDPPIEWPSGIAVALPIAWAALVASLGAAFCKKEK